MSTITGNSGQERHFAPRDGQLPRLGVLISGQTRPDLGLAVTDAYQDALVIAAEAEGYGYDDFWTSEHHGEDDGYCPSPTVLGAGLAAVTRRAVIAHGITVTPLQGHPLTFAEAMTVLDNLSGGRAEIGAGQGYRVSEFDAIGLNYRTRTRAFDEGLDIIDLAWTGEPFDYDGDIYRSTGGLLRPAPVRPGLPALWLGAANSAARERVVSRRAGLLLHPLAEHELAIRQLQSFDRACEEAGVGPLPKAITREMFIADTDEEALEASKEYLDHLYRVQYSPERTGVTYADPQTGERRTITSADDPDYLSAHYVQSRMIVGSPDTCARIVTDLVSEGKIDRLVVRGQFPGQPRAEALHMLETFIREVPPRVTALLGGIQS